MEDLFAKQSGAPYIFSPPYDLEDAYDNRSYINGAQNYIDTWPKRSSLFADNHEGAIRNCVYGDHGRQSYDLFFPKEPAPKGLIIFVHGGYWMSLSKDHFLHLAKGPLAHGWAVANVGYRLCPEVFISQITSDVSNAIKIILTQSSVQIDGPVRLVGHSAGGHLVTRMMCDDTTLPGAMLAQIDKVVSVSGVHDLRPLLTLSHNQALKLTEAEALSESLICRRPCVGPSLVCVVGNDERPEFVRQSALLPYVWYAMGCNTALHIEPEHDHFSIIDTLEHHDSVLTKIVLG